MRCRRPRLMELIPLTWSCNQISLKGLKVTSRIGPLPSLGETSALTSRTQPSLVKRFKPELAQIKFFTYKAWFKEQSRYWPPPNRSSNQAKIKTQMTLSASLISWSNAIFQKSLKNIKSTSLYQIRHPSTLSCQRDQTCPLEELRWFRTTQNRPSRRIWVLQFSPKQLARLLYRQLSCKLPGLTLSFSPAFFSSNLQMIHQTPPKVAWHRNHIHSFVSWEDLRSSKRLPYLSWTAASRPSEMGEP